MHRSARRDIAYAPGLTPLTGQYSRPEVAYVCTSRVVPGLSVAVDHDISGALWECTPAKQVIAEAKTLYYLAKAVKFIGGITP